MLYSLRHIASIYIFKLSRMSSSETSVKGITLIPGIIFIAVDISGYFILFSTTFCSAPFLSKGYSLYLVTVDIISFPNRINHIFALNILKRFVPPHHLTYIFLLLRIAFFQLTMTFFLKLITRF